MLLHGSLKCYDIKIGSFQLERQMIENVENHWKQRLLSFKRLLWV